MAVTRERFDSGLTYEQYKAQMTRNRERLEANEQRVSFDPADLEVFQRLPRPLNALALAEDWCGDVIANLPVLARLAAASGKLNLRIFLRDQNLDLMDQYLKEGKYRSIPVFVLLDERLDEIGRFIERPASVTALRAERQAELHARHPEFGPPGASPAQLPEDVRARYAEEMTRLREDTADFANREVVRELRAIVERVPD